MSVPLHYYRGGVYLPKIGLWLDPHEPQPGEDKVFISHAHSDHIGLHREVILSEPTSKLMHERLKGQWVEHVLPFKIIHHLDGRDCSFKIMLLPAGHIFGSSMCLIETNNTSVLYTGDFKLRPGLSAEACEPCPADILIMETTYGRPHYVFPSTAEVMQGIIRFCREALDNDETPALLGYSLGKSQELLCGLAEVGLPIMLHGEIAKLTKIYEQFGQRFPAYEKYESTSARGKVLLCPPSVANSALLWNLGQVRTAILTGWAVDPNCRFQYHADAAFPLSDHADFPDLIELVRRVSPRKVYTLHGFAAEFAQTLREQGYDAQALSQQEQLALPLVETEPRSNLQTSKSAKAVGGLQPELARETSDSQPLPPRLSSEVLLPDSFHAFAVTCSSIGSTSKKLEKTQKLADYLNSLSSGALSLVSTWFTGNPFPPSQNKVLQLGWAIIRESLCSAGKLNHVEFGRVYLKHSDLGETCLEILLTTSPPTATLTLQRIDTLFHQLYVARGPSAKLPLLADGLRRCTALEGKYLIKILTGDLRIGLKEGLVEEALARAFQATIEEVKNANLLLGNIGETAELAKHGRLGSASLIPFRPFKFMLASPEESATAIWERIHDRLATNRNDEPTRTVWLEDKYDGIRCQVHKVHDQVRLYSRDLKEISEAFRELLDKARPLKVDFILDGEIVAMRGDQVLPFAELQKRLGRREGDLFLRKEIPVQFIVFDLLWLSGDGYLNRPLRARRAALEQLPLPFHLAQITHAHSASEIELAFSVARGRGNEGLMIKDPSSVYTPGRRGLSWLKLKKAYATLDCVVVGAEYGHGKRNAVLSDYTFAVRDEKSGQLKTIGKAYTGLTDDEITGLTKHFLSKAIRQQGRYYEVEPDTVLEIAFDIIQPSKRHTSGLALRFPRIVRIRTDRAPSEIDTLEAAWRLVEDKKRVGEH